MHNRHAHPSRRRSSRLAARLFDSLADPSPRVAFPPQVSSPVRRRARTATVVAAAPEPSAPRSARLARKAADALALAAGANLALVGAARADDGGVGVGGVAILAVLGVAAFFAGNASKGDDRDDDDDPPPPSGSQDSKNYQKNLTIAGGAADRRKKRKPPMPKNL